jgi:hypothetical protein
MYKDKERQKQANKEAKAKWQAKQAVKLSPGCPPEQKVQEYPTGIPSHGIPAKYTLDDIIRTKNYQPLTTAELEHNQRVYASVDADTRARIASLSIADLQATDAFIPVWRQAQG